MTQTHPAQTFISAAGLVTDSEDAVTLGSLSPGDAPVGVDALMKVHTGEIDALLKKLPDDSVDALELLIRRGFTYEEYLQFFQPFRKGHEQRLAYRAMFIDTDERRRDLLFNLSQDYDGYISLLARTLHPFHPHLSAFFKICPTRAHFWQRHVAPFFNNWKVWEWKI